MHFHKLTVGNLQQQRQQQQLQLQLQQQWQLLCICVCHLFLLNILIKLLLLFFSAHFLDACVPSQLILLFCQQRFIYLYWWPAHTQADRKTDRQTISSNICMFALRVAERKAEWGGQHGERAGQAVLAKALQCSRQLKRARKITILPANSRCCDLRNCWFINNMCIIIIIINQKVQHAI